MLVNVDGERLINSFQKPFEILFECETATDNLILQINLKIQLVSKDLLFFYMVNHQIM